MLKNIKLSNFRKHVDSFFEFGPGLTALRGSNEQGKSTIQESIAYALFGVKALRGPLSDAVTWDQPESSLKVVLDLELDGVDYTITRGKAGAECTYRGGIVTGQTEVSNFMASKLRVDANGAAKLMMSAQSDIRGALEAGPKATTELIERLSDFNQIDHLIEIMQEKLTLGSTAAAQSKIDSAQERLDAVNAIVQPDWVTLEAGVTLADAQVKVEQIKVDAAQAAHTAAQKEQAEVAAALGEAQRLQKQADDVEARLTVVNWKLKELADNPVKDFPNADEVVQGLLAKKADYADFERRLAAYTAVEHLLDDGPTRESTYIGDPKIELDAVRVATAKASKEVSDAKIAIERCKGQLNSGNCTFCGKDFSDLPEIKQKNKELTDVIAAHEKTIANLSKSIENHSQLEARLLGILKSAKPYEDAVRKYGDFLDVCDTYTPPILSWKGEVPIAIGVFDPRNADSEIHKVRSAVKAHADYADALKVNQRSAKDLASQAHELARLQEQVRLAGDIAQATQKLADAAQALKDARGLHGAAQVAHLEARDALKDARREWDGVVKERTGCNNILVSHRETLRELNFNNALLKKVRSARPAIADKLWSLVLHAVSSYFSEMRGEKSVVSKTSDGFMVDGHPVASLSGSTLDILGLAVRVALVRTFLPAVPFLILDEPMQGCDMARTESMLGFLVAAGFKQILLITHEEASESVADHVITLGE